MDLRVAMRAMKFRVSVRVQTRRAKRQTSKQTSLATAVYLGGAISQLHRSNAKPPPLVKTTQTSTIYMLLIHAFIHGRCKCHVEVTRPS